MKVEDGVHRSCAHVLRMVTVGVMIAAGLSAAWAGQAQAASGKPVTVASGIGSQPPAVAVSAAGTAFIAWNNNTDLGGSNNFVQYCVLPAGASACSHTGSLVPADGAVAIDGVHVVADGSTIAILADVFGAQGNNAADYMPEQEWQSTDGGATFSIVNGGLSVTDGIKNADTGPLSAVIVPGTNVLGFAWDTAGGPPTFNAFPLNSPPECSITKCAAGFATLQPSTQVPLSNVEGQFAAQAGSHPGVLGVFSDLGGNAPYQCADHDNIPYVYGSGNQSASNSYNVSPGAPGSAWRLPLSFGVCNAHNPAVGGGPSGFGIVASNEANGTTSYWPFDQTHTNFDLKPVVLSDQPQLSSSVNQDAAGGIYATWQYDGAGGSTALSYSGDGGKTWTGPSLINSSMVPDLTSSVGPSGQGWATWQDSGIVYAQQFNKTDASAVSLGGGATSTSKTVTVTVSCTTLPCTVTITITVTITGPAQKATAAKAKKKRTVVLARRHLTVRKSGPQHVVLHLTKQGRKLLAARHGRATATLLETAAVQDDTVKAKRTIHIKPGKKRKK
jgi:hypothetical protein